MQRSVYFMMFIFFPHQTDLNSKLRYSRWHVYKLSAEIFLCRFITPIVSYDHRMSLLSSLDLFELEDANVLENLTTLSQIFSCVNGSGGSHMRHFFR